MKPPVRVAVTGAAGQIGYSLLFRIASGQMLGPDQPVILQLLEVTPAMKALEGVVMEIEDCAFPLSAGFVLADDANTAFKEVDYALLVGAKPRGPGMERGDLLEANGGIFKVQGQALNANASRDVKVLVVGVILEEVLIGTSCCLGFKFDSFIVVAFRSVFSVVGVVPPSAIFTTPPRLKFESGTSSSLSSSISRSSTSKGTSSGIVASSLLPI